VVASNDPVKSAALGVLKKVGLGHAPIDVEAIAAKIGAIVTYEAFKEDLSGVLIKEKTRTVIGVNSSHPQTRQRFTIAHEIGHLVLQHKGEIFVDQTVVKRDGKSSRAVDRQEIDANRFAAELLMPERLVLEAVHRRQERSSDISATQIVDELAIEFQVSPQAMEYRLTNLGMFIPR
jgi:Zn-dependent peptidase ImmA (M78 family)